jgi:hypothetical protein
MKKFITRTGIALLLSGSVLLSGCYGSFNLLHSVYDWNGTIEDKTVRSVVFWALVIIPVYEVAALVDAAVLNVIEHWSGENPLSMQQGEVDKRTVLHEGKRYTIEARKNRFTVRELGKNRAVDLLFNTRDASWNLVAGDRLITLSKLERSGDGDVALRIFSKSGSSAVVPCPDRVEWLGFSSALGCGEPVAAH